MIERKISPRINISLWAKYSYGTKIHFKISI